MPSLGNLRAVPRPPTPTQMALLRKGLLFGVPWGKEASLGGSPWEPPLGSMHAGRTILQHMMAWALGDCPRHFTTFARLSPGQRRLWPLATMPLSPTGMGAGWHAQGPLGEGHREGSLMGDKSGSRACLSLRSDCVICLRGEGYE